MTSKRCQRRLRGKQRVEIAASIRRKLQQVIDYADDMA
jgi:hypothetical protein